jgi:hypothetical protein
MDDWSAVRLVLAILEGFIQTAGLDAPHVLAPHSNSFWMRAGAAFTDTPQQHHNRSHIDRSSGRQREGRPGGLRTGSPPSPPPRLIRPTVRLLLGSRAYRVRPMLCRTSWAPRNRPSKSLCDGLGRSERSRIGSQESAARVVNLRGLFLRQWTLRQATMTLWPPMV